MSIKDPNEDKETSDSTLSTPHLFLTNSDQNMDRLQQNDVLRVKIHKLETINHALIRRVERAVDGQAGGYALFQSAILLEEQVRLRTIELRQAVNEIEAANTDLSLAKEQAEKLNAGKTKFIAAASHDLLQPLSAARLNMSALKTKDVSPQAENLILQIDRSLKTIEDLLRTLFDISKLDTGVHQPEICCFPADRIVKSLFADFSAIATQNNLALSIYPRTFQVETDPIFLRRILQNLVSNALRYTQTGGVLIGCRKRGPFLRFEVWDTGRGIPLSEHDKIFDEFHRCPGERHQDGLGLGLAIVKRMAQTLNHSVDFASKPGQGSMFCVSVPLSTRQSGDDRGQAEEELFLSPSLSIKLDNAFIVIIEDDPNQLNAMTTLLNQWRAISLGADSIARILTVLKTTERCPDLIIADYHLSNDSRGHQAVTKIREKFSHHIPAIIVTADPSPEMENAARLTDCEFMTKPIEPAEMRALIAHLLR